MARTPRASRPKTPSWRRVRALAKGDPAIFRRALADCAEGHHREPVYACMYACAHDADHARELTQAFFATLRERADLPILRPEDLPRIFLQGCVLHFLFNDLGHEVRRRGDGQRVIALRLESGERARQREPVDVDTLRRIFDRAWAVQIFGGLLQEIRREGVDEAEGKLVDCMEAYVNGPPEDGEEDSEQEQKRQAGEYLLNEMLKPDPTGDQDDSG